MSYAIWGVILLGIALLLFFVELFIPSGGLIGFLAAATLVGGIVLLFLDNTTLGLVGMIISLAGAPFLFALAIKVWPNTPLARMLTLGTPRPNNEEDDASRLADAAANVAPLAELGASGRALTDLRPVGTCLIDGQRAECLAETGLIRAGMDVRVTAVDGMQIKVRQVE